jgi:hypothetical protein
MTIKKRIFTNENKAHYELWWEYLKRNATYEMLCKARKNPWAVLFNRTRKVSWSFPERITAYRAYNWRHDVHSSAFEDWWKERTTDEGQVVGPIVKQPVSYAGSALTESIESFIAAFEKREGREPTTRDLKDHLAREIETSFGGRSLCLVVSRSPFAPPLDEIRREFEALVKPKPYRPKVRMFLNFSTKPKLPPKDELRRHLLEWDVKKEEHAIREIMEQSFVVSPTLPMAAVN